VRHIISEASDAWLTPVGAHAVSAEERVQRAKLDRPAPAVGPVTPDLQAQYQKQAVLSARLTYGASNEGI
jgi:hypothetical protein